MRDDMVDDGAVPVKEPPFALSDSEVQRLILAFTRGKREVLEDDVLALMRWAQQMKMSGMLLHMVFDGDLVPVVEHGEVKLSLAAHHRARTN